MPTRKVAMLQPNYIPWKGVFDLINRVDVFVFYDDVQYTKRDWRNRNKIKTKDGELWLTVPVKATREDLICDVLIDNSTNWQEKHFKSINSSYAKAPFYSEYKWFLEEIYFTQKWEKISELDIYATKKIAEILEIEAQWVLASELKISGGKEGEKVIKICNELGCNHFINGPSAKGFMDADLFRENEIALDYIEYNYPPYPQLHGEFNHYVTVLDLLFHCGKDSKKFICKE